MPETNVDVIIPTYKPDKIFRLLLQRLQEQTFVVHRIIVANTCQDLWNRFLEEEGNQFLEESSVPIEIFHVEKDDFDHGGTRRLAVQRSQAAYFICMTQDALPEDENLIEQLLLPFRDENIAAVCGRQLPAAGCSVVEQYTRSFNYPNRDMVKSKDDIKRLGIKTFFCSNVCAAYRRSSYEALGGFEEHTIFNEDMIYTGHAVLAGYKIAYASKARVIHSHNYTGLQQYRRNFDLAVSQKQHPEVFKGIRSESEGIRMVRKTARYLLKIKKPWLIANLIWQSGWKLMGYRAGLRYENMKPARILRCTMNQSYWHKSWNTKQT